MTLVFVFSFLCNKQHMVSLDMDSDLSLDDEGAVLASLRLSEMAKVGVGVEGPGMSSSAGS